VQLSSKSAADYPDWSTIFYETGFQIRNRILPARNFLLMSYPDPLLPTAHHILRHCEPASRNTHKL